MTTTEPQSPEGFSGLLHSLTDDDGRPLPMSPEDRLAQFQRGKRRRRLAQISVAGVTAAAVVLGGVALAESGRTVQTAPAERTVKTAFADAVAATKVAGPARFQFDLGDANWMSDTAVSRKTPSGPDDDPMQSGTLNLATGEETGQSDGMGWLRTRSGTFVVDPSGYDSLPAGKKWYSISEEKARFWGIGGVRGLVEGIASATEVRRVREETVDGTPTVRYSAVLEKSPVAALLGDDSADPGRGVPEGGEAPQDASAPFRTSADLWVDGDGRIRAIRLPAWDDIRDPLRGDEVFKPYLVVLLSDFGAPLDTTEPAAEEVVPLSEQYAIPS